MLLCWAGLFFPAIPVAPIICAALLSLVIRRIVAHRRVSRAAVPAADNNFEMTAIVGD
jgi:hypothetical protein